MSTELLKAYLGATKKFISHPKVFVPRLHSKCIKLTLSNSYDVQTFRPFHLCKMPPPQRIPAENRPFRNYFYLGRIHLPYRTCSLHKLGNNFGISCERNGPYRNHSFPTFDGSKGYKTLNTLQQADKQQKAEEINKEAVQPEEKLSLFKRYKKMLKEYWYVLVPVHVATSLIWFGSFYYLALCGIDIVPFLEKLGLGESIIGPLKKSSLGYLAVASALYKVATPARYMVTVGGTTVAISYLTKYGLLKPVPSKAKIKSMIQNKFKQQEKQTKGSS